MKQIVIADDDPVVLRIMRVGLEAAGYAVRSAANGAECFAMVCDTAPDLLVTDIQMPEMTGKELCLAIADRFAARPFPIVVLTGRAELEHREWTKQLQGIHFMEKPVSMRRLIAHAGGLLGNDSVAPDRTVSQNR